MSFSGGRNIRKTVAPELIGPPKPSHYIGISLVFIPAPYKAEGKLLGWSISAKSPRSLAACRKASLLTSAKIKHAEDSFSALGVLAVHIFQKKAIRPIKAIETYSEVGSFLIH